MGWGGTGYTPVPGQDFDGDGKADIAIYSEASGYWSVLRSTTSYTTVLNIGWGGRGYTLVPGDYDGDGKADAGLYDRATGNWLILKSNSGYTTTIGVSWGGAGYDPVPGDYDADGKIDLGIVQRSTGNCMRSCRFGAYDEHRPAAGRGGRHAVRARSASAQRS